MRVSMGHACAHTWAIYGGYMGHIGAYIGHMGVAL